MAMRDPVAVLKREGCNVRVVSGYSTRGGSGMNPVGVMLHHTASSRRSGDSGALGICTNGRTGLPGPLCNIHVSRSGVMTVVALEKANHAGKGSGTVLAETRRGVAPSGDARARRLSDTMIGNAYYIGVEIENDGIGEPWSPQQVDAIIRMCAALCRLYGWDANRVICHREWSARKPDTALRLDWRGQTRARLGGKPAPLPTPAPYKPADAYMRKGSTGETVKNLQRALGIPADGDFGPATDRAVRAFQTKHGSTADGIVGPATLALVAKHGIKPAAKVVVPPKIVPPAPKVPTWWKRTLRSGSEGADVKALQGVVGASPADGKFGPATAAKVKAWQTAHKITADGIVGPGTAAAMQAAPKPTPKPPAPKPAPKRPAPTKPSWYTRALKRGMQGNDVKNVQRVVGATPADGKFGPGTESKVKAWQKRNGLTADGIFGPSSAGKAVGK